MVGMTHPKDLSTNHDERQGLLGEEESLYSFEEALKELESIVEQLEGQDVPLEKAVALFQKGIKLSSLCHAKLKKAEEQVQILLGKDEELELKPFHVEEEED